jgi:molybdopterin molybdotransferase
MRNRTAPAPPVIGFAAWSGTGKTTLLCQVIPILVDQGFRIGVIKHTHHSFEIDRPGKDSHELRLAGARQVMIASETRQALITESPESPGIGIAEYCARLDTAGLDLIVLEGFRHQRVPKIEVYRPDLGRPPLYPEDRHVVAVATDGGLPAPHPPKLDINQPDTVAAFLVRYLQAGDHGPGDDACAPPRGDHGMLDFESARDRVLNAVNPLRGSVRVPIREALGRILAADLHSPLSLPAWANAAMDGYAVRARDTLGEPVELEMIGSAFAGMPFQGVVKAGQCVRIMTGAVLPEGADAVEMQERTERREDRVLFAAPVPAGQFVRPAGDDIRAGQRLLAADQRLRPADIGLLAASGLGEITVRPRPRVAFMSTGDELQGLGTPLGKGQIHDSNRYTLHAMLSSMPVEIHDWGVVRDRPAEVRTALREAAAGSDVVITSGGVSVGAADHVTSALRQVGDVDFWRIAMKPGKPLAFGRIGEALFFGLPGNPVSVMVTFQQFVAPAIRRLGGEQQLLPLEVRARCLRELRKEPGRLEFQRGRLWQDASGELLVESSGGQGSHRLSSLTEANCFIVLPRFSDGASPGTWVRVQPFDTLV